MQISALGSPTLRALIALYVTGLVLLDVRQTQTRVTDILPARCHDALNRLLRVMPFSTRLVMRLLMGLVQRLGVAGYLCLDDVITEAAYQRRLEKLRAQYGVDAVDALLSQPAAPPPEQNITNTAPNQGAQGIFYGNVYLYGQRGKQAREIIGAYLQRQLPRCGSLPLQGVYQQKATHDTLEISLEQVSSLPSRA